MTSSQDTIMGVDLGTQSIKVIIYCPKSHKVIATPPQPLNLISKVDGSMEQLSDWWISGFKKCIKMIDVNTRKTVVAIGVSGQQHGFVPLNKQGEVLAPVKLWCDTATEVECAEIMNTIGGQKECVSIAGNPISVGYTASKIRWLKKNNPIAYKNMSTILLPHDYMNFYLTGTKVMEAGDASGTGLFDIRNKKWCKPLITAIDEDRDLNPCLPEIIKADSIVGIIKQEVAKDLGLNNRVIVSAGGGDNMMAAIGTGNVEAGKLTASLGTSGTLFAYSDHPVIDPQGELAAFISSTGGWLPLLCNMNCTVATEKMRNLFEVDLTKMEQLASRIPPGSDGVITMPFFNGERAPALPKAKASIFGLDCNNTTNAHLIRSTMEAVIFNLKNGKEAFMRCGMNFTEVTLTGGGSKSTLWRQMCADILNLPVRVLMTEENAAFGAALQAYWVYEKQRGNPKSITQITKDHLVVDESKSCLPNPSTVKEYEKIYQNYQTFVKLITKHYQ